VEWSVARVTVDKAWLVQDPGEGLDESIDRAIREHGMTPTRAAGKVEMLGGSQLKMRVLGAWFVKDSVLPKRGSLERIGEPNRSNVEQITLHLEDLLGVFVMDPKVRNRYERLFESIAVTIEAALRSNAGDIPDALKPEAV
jgi:hypothetical protein